MTPTRPTPTQPLNERANRLANEICDAGGGCACNPEPRLSPMARRVAANKAAGRRTVDEIAHGGVRPAGVR